MTGPEAPEAEQPLTPEAAESPSAETPAAEVAPSAEPAAAEATPAPPVETPPPLPGPFLVAGLGFQRQEDGGVAIKRYASANPDVAPILVAILDPDSWCSVVAAVSASGDTGVAFQLARGLHAGRISE